MNLFISKSGILLYGICALSLLRPLSLSAQQKDKSDTPLFQEKFRPQFHLTPVKGWVNDPTALVYVNGLYQVNKRLAVSTDLIHWKLEMLPNGFNPNDSVGEMSGSAVVDVNNTSGFGINGKPPLVSIWSGLRFKDMRQYQCISYSNDEGRTWTRYDKNPVIDIGSTEFRDPQVFWYGKDKKWVMVVALAAERKVKFYGSSDLKNWTFLSDFGPAGADNGVWECPDIFALPVDGNKAHIKWVLEVSVQPTGGQYFVGSFDGTRFIADADFKRKTREHTAFAGNILFDFEKDLTGWEVEGSAFSASPYGGSMPMQGAVLGYKGKKLVNSFFHGDSTVGKITSPSFLLNKRFLNFMIGGGEHPGTLLVNLIVDNQIAKTQTGPNTEALQWVSWNIAQWKGKPARIEIVDQEKGGFGHITVDQVTLSDQAARNEIPKAFWLDYGPDYYAVRSWVNGPAGDERRISVAWMSNWLYAEAIPTTPWKGIHTFPRVVELKTFPQGIRLVQNPIPEIQLLRENHFNHQEINIGPVPAPVRFPHDKNAYELVAEIDPKNSKEVGFNLCVGKNEKTVVRYDVLSKTIHIDRRASGLTAFSKTFPGSYAAPFALNKDGKLKLRILVDQCSIEVFAGEGETTLTTQVFPEANSLGVEVFSVGGNATLKRLDTWSLRPIWENSQENITHVNPTE